MAVQAHRNGSASVEPLLQGRVPPHSAEAERSVLGAMLRDNGIIGDVLQILKSSENFYLDAHRTIFEAIQTLYHNGQPIDLVILHEHLQTAKLIEQVGGLPYLARIFDETPTAANATYYAEIVRDKAIIRSLIHSGTEIIRDALEQNGPAVELLEGAERKIMQIAEWGVAGQTYTISDALNEAMERIDSRHNRDPNSTSGLPTGYVDLNNITAGLQDSELIIVAARPSIGKTAFTLNLLRNVALDEGLPVFFASLEQSRTELAERLLAAEGLIDSHKLRKGHISLEDMRTILAASDRLRQAKIFIDDSPGQNMLRIAANARRLKLRHGIRLVVIDYLQLIEPDNRKDSRQEQVAAISRRLKFLAKELAIPVIACAQLNRGVENRADNEPKLSDLRESGSIEQDADTVMLLHRPKDPNTGLDREGVLEILIAKQRNGPTGKVTLAHRKQYMRFENYAGDIPNYA